MHEETTLLSLQNIDIQLKQAQKEAKELASSKDTDPLKENIRHLEKQLLQVKGLKTDTLLEADGYGRLIQDAEREIAKTKTVLNESSDYRRMASFEKQLTDLQKRIEKNAFKKAKVEKKLERIVQAEKNGNSQLETVQAELAQRVTEKKERLVALANKTKELKQKKDTLFESLPNDIAERYKKAQERFNMRGIETLQGNKPSACRITLQPSQLSQIEAADGAITTCPYCGRILIKKDVSEE